MPNAVAENKKAETELKKKFSLVLTEKLDGISTALPKVPPRSIANPI